MLSLFWKQDESGLEPVVDGLKSSCDSRMLQLDARRGLLKDVVAYVKSEAPSFFQGMQNAINPLSEVEKYDLDIIKSEKRLYEDLNDIIERRRVILRLMSEYENSLKEVERTKSIFKRVESEYQLETENSSFGKRLQNAELTLKQAKEDKKMAVLNAISITSNLIDAKKKYSLFMKNRIIHGMLQYANKLKYVSDEESRIYLRMSELFSDLRKSLSSVSDDTQPETLTVFNDISNPFDSLI